MLSNDGDIAFVKQSTVQDFINTNDQPALDSFEDVSGKVILVRSMEGLCKLLICCACPLLLSFLLIL